MSTTPNRRPGGARPNPSSSRPAPLPPKLSIPEGNVREYNSREARENAYIPPATMGMPLPMPSGVTSQASASASALPSSASSVAFPRPVPFPSPAGMNVDQAGQGGWQQVTELPPLPNLPSLAMRPGRQMPSLVSAGPSGGTPGRPKLTLAGVGGGRSGSAPALSLPTLALGSSSSSSLSPASARSGAPLLKLSIPLDGGGGGAAFSNNSDDGSNLRTPMPGEEDRDVTVHARTYHLQRDEDFGAADKMAKLTEEVRNAMSRMRPFDASPDPSTGGRSRSGSATGSASGASGAPPGSGDDLTKLRAVNLSGISDGDDSRPSSVHSGPEHFDERTHFTVLRRLGEGTGGAVDLVTTSTGQVMARKVIARTANPAIHKQTLRELEFLSSTSSPYIVNHYGAFLAEHDQQICIIMEYCEAGSLDSLLDRMKETGLLCTEPVLGRIAASVLRGLNYLHELQIIHRDIKPSNILVTRQGAVKLCDFGVSGELVGSFAQTFTGTSYYMAPERILHKPYTIKADVWSLGLTLHEVANLRFPFPPEGENQAVAPIELLSYIVTAPVPALQDNPAIGRIWSQDIRRFMDRCLIRDGTERPYPRDLISDPFIVSAERKNVNMAKWVAALVPSLKQ